MISKHNKGLREKLDASIPTLPLRSIAVKFSLVWR